MEGWMEEWVDGWMDEGIAVEMDSDGWQLN